MKAFKVPFKAYRLAKLMKNDSLGHWKGKAFIELFATALVSEWKDYSDRCKRAGVKY